MLRFAIVILSILILISLDMLSKIFVRDTLFGSWQSICSDPGNHTFATVAYCQENTLSIFDWLSIELSYNSGIAFSLPITGLPLQIITIILVIWLIAYYLQTEYSKRSKLLDAGYTLIIAGALSHTYERIFVGHVIDFISVQYFAIFNFADIFISIGACLLFIAYYVRKS